VTATEQTTRPMDAAIGLRVHLIMWDRRITQQELGDAIGMDQSSLGKRLRGDRGWTPDQVVSVARALGTTVAYLFGETSELTPTEPLQVIPSD
jgi:transcriptional regulator with XRE-family HTH domain